MHLLVTRPAALAEARAVVDTELDAIELAASRFRPDSEICMLADAGGQRTPVSPVLADLIEAALAAASFTARRRGSRPSAPRSSRWGMTATSTTWIRPPRG